MHKKFNDLESVTEQISRRWVLSTMICHYTLLKLRLKWPSTSQSVRSGTGKIFECGFMASDDAYGSYKTYGKVRLTFGPL